MLPRYQEGRGFEVAPCTASFKVLLDDFVMENHGKIMGRWWFYGSLVVGFDRI